MNDISISAVAAFAGELVADEQGDVRHAMGKIDEEGLVVMAVDEIDRLFGVPGGELGLVLGGDFFDDRGRALGIAFPKGKGWVAAFVALGLRRKTDDIGVERPHIVGIGKAKEFVEAVVRGAIFREDAEVPFPENGGGVSEGFEHAGDGGFLFA